jgi:hypothetical protein
MTTEDLVKLASERSNPCISISFNTHRTKPDNLQDVIMLKNMIKEAEEKILAEYDKRSASSVLEKLSNIDKDLDHNYNLDSMHIFISENMQYLYRSPWKATDNIVSMSDRFNIKHLIKNWNNTEDYLILTLSQSGVNLYEATNDSITQELRTEGFPFPQNPHYLTSAEANSDTKQTDNLVREFFNKVDKALVRVHNATERRCVVISTSNNFTLLNQVADKPSAYYGFAPINYNDVAPHTITRQAWDVVLEDQKTRRTAALEELKSAISQGKVVTDLGEIYKAIEEGRGELLIAHTDFKQAARISDNNLELVENPNEPNTIEDITSELAWGVISKKGRAVFTQRDDIKEIGDIALKVRY